MKLMPNTGTELPLINPALDALEAARRGEFPADFEHPFLDVPEPLRSRLPTEFVYRDLHVSRYGFAVPTEALVRYLAARSLELGGIVEVGAGAGYIASLVLQVDGIIFPTDLYPEGWPTPHTMVTQQDACSSAVESAQAGQGLLFSWPDMDAWTEQALDAYLKAGGRAVFVIGEGANGCTGMQLFHVLLHQGRMVFLPPEVDVVRFPGVRDRFSETLFPG